MRNSTTSAERRCDKFSNLNKVTIATAFALFFFVTSTAQAANVSLTIDPTQSFLTQGQVFDISSLGGQPKGTLVLPSVPQDPGVPSDTSHLSGSLLVDLTPTTLQLIPGSAIDYEETGSYLPGPVDNANYGIKLDPLQLRAVLYGLTSDFNLDDPGPIMPINPGPLGTFDLAGNVLHFTSGFLDTVSIGGPSSDDQTGGEAALLGTGAADIGSWDGHTLTIPIHSSAEGSVLLGQAEIFITLLGEGVIVATIPEPSTFVLFGFGALGLVTCAWRARARKSAARSR